jgi:hypothetical protein
VLYVLSIVANLPEQFPNFWAMVSMLHSCLDDVHKLLVHSIILLTLEGKFDMRTRLKFMEAVHQLHIVSSLYQTLSNK